MPLFLAQVKSEVAQRRETELVPVVSVGVGRLGAGIVYYIALLPLLDSSRASGLRQQSQARKGKPLVQKCLAHGVLRFV